MESITDLFQVFDDDETEKDVQEDVVQTKSDKVNSSQSRSVSKRFAENSTSALKTFKRRKGNDDEKLDNDDTSGQQLYPRIEIHHLDAPVSCVHEVAVFPKQELIPLRPIVNPAKTYSFVLDPFQKEAILCIDNHQSVLVSAHTSAGKTVVAEYAIAKSLIMKQRVIYTTPIKALSNQKYREFNEEFKDVGLITGDVTINPNASCLIMTTEILRNMLYRGNEIMREVGWVVFDEIHYMRDKERGVVWEETLILLPDNVRFVFLSATIPNAQQFAEWVCHLHKQPCHVVYTEYRPTPLSHFIFPAGGDGIHLIVDDKGTFKEENFNKAMATLATAGETAQGDERGRKGGFKNANNNNSNIFKVVKMIVERSFAPVIAFSFSKKECEAYAMAIAKLNLNSKDERVLVDEVFSNAIAVLSKEDKLLPQVVNILPLLRRGIGIHHGGLLPILKEVVEILFAEGLLKVLFATETFAMGLNMPARTVLFTAPRKFDGKDFRWITSGEYIQMAGRAGRRGLDQMGLVIFMIDEKVSPAVGREILQGRPDPINSAFHLTYNMVLNLLRVEEINPEYMLERSFFQFQNQSKLPDLQKSVNDLTAQIKLFEIEDEHNISSYYHIKERLRELEKQQCAWVTRPLTLLKFLHPGRLIKVTTPDGVEFDWGLVLSVTKPNQKNKNPTKPDSESLSADVLLHCEADCKEDGQPLPCTGKKGIIKIVPVQNNLIVKLSSIRVYHPADLRSEESRRAVYKTIQEVKERFPNGIPLLNPETDMQITAPEFQEICKTLKTFEDRLEKHPLHKSPDLKAKYEEYEKKKKLQGQLTAAKLKLKEAYNLLQMDELKARKRVLRRLEYCNESDVILAKGRVACELSAADELLITELIFNGVFNDLTPAQSVALLSCFVCDEKSNEHLKSVEELSGPLRRMQDTARQIARCSKECKLELDEDDYVEKFKPSLMDVVYAWCKGASFMSCLQLTQIFEGSIIRCMRRLEELLRQMVQAAKTIGNTDLENKFAEGVVLIKRDIAFAASLYL